MSRYTVERSYLVRVVQTYTFETEYDLHEWLENDWSGADEAICAQGDLCAEETELIDNDELDVQILKAETDREEA